MKTVQFKTNIKCAGCVSKVTPALNEAVGKDHWKVDIDRPDKMLTITSDGLNEKDIKLAVEKAGFTAEKIE